MEWEFTSHGMVSKIYEKLQFDESEDVSERQIIMYGRVERGKMSKNNV